MKRQRVCVRLKLYTYRRVLVGKRVIVKRANKRARTRGEQQSVNRVGMPKVGEWSETRGAVTLEQVVGGKGSCFGGSAS